MPYKNNKKILSISNQNITLQEKGKKLFDTGLEVKKTGTVKKTEHKISNQRTLDIKNENIKKTQVTKTKSEIKQANVTKKTEVKNNTVEKKKKLEITPKNEVKSKGNDYTSGIDKNKKVDIIPVTPKVKDIIKKTDDKIKSDLNTRNENKTVIKTGNTNNTSIKKTKEQNVTNNNTNYETVKTGNTNKTEIKTGNTNKTEIKSGNTNKTEIKIEPPKKIENTSTKVKSEPKIIPDTKVNQSQNNSNNKKK
jgi:hypothetical protein